uniref:Uncharacterized protein C10orf55-like n=1 Tax=Sus scrofa TaxID=9823 RepID=A0A480RE36_PIG
MKDHRFPAERNGLTQASFTNQVPAEQGSPCGFFLPCQPLRAHLVLNTPMSHLPYFPGRVWPCR